MDLHIAVKWLEALRSGRYRQTTGKLNGFPVRDVGEDGTGIRDGFCCLGVLCDLHREFINDQLAETVASWDNDGRYVCGGFQASSVLPRNVQEWAGLDSQNPRFEKPIDGDGCRWVYLSELNDVGKPFDEIATTIEAHADSL